MECGMAWFAQRDDGWEAACERDLRAQGIPVERLERRGRRAALPHLGPAGLAFLLHEPEAGVVRAQRAVQALVRQAAAHGATVMRARAHARRATGSRLEDGRVLEGDVVVWACGALARQALPRARVRAPRAAGAVLPRRRPGLARPGVPAWVDSTPRSTARTTSTGSA